jgi:hypothetical protein
VGKRRFTNPFRPGAGHTPPYLAGRGKETKEFKRLLDQEVILENLILTGLRGVGKTVLLDTFKPIAIKAGWLWVGTDLSEAASPSEERIVIRLLSDLASLTAHLPVQLQNEKFVGFNKITTNTRLDYATLEALFRQTPGLVADRMKFVLEFIWNSVKQLNLKGIIFAYDEAQNMADHAERNEFPLSLMLDCFQSIQKKDIPFMLVLAGLPTLFPKLVEARTFSERMFRVVFLDRLNETDSRDAIEKPINDANCPVKLHVEPIVNASGGYPYFIQFVCREAYDSYLQQSEAGIDTPTVFIADILRKLDSDFFAGRWARATDRQRDLLMVIANTEHADSEFTLQEVSNASRRLLSKPFSPSQISQMFLKLGESGLVYKNRHGKYAFAVPLLGEFIRRQEMETS